MNLVDETGSEKPKSTNCKPGGKKNEKEKIINCIGSSNTCIIHGWMWQTRINHFAGLTVSHPTAPQENLTWMH